MALKTQVKPKILLRYGRAQQPIRVPLYDLLVDAVQTFLTADTQSVIGSLTVMNTTGFAINQILIIGQVGNEGSEIIKTHASSAPTATTITLATNTIYPHSTNTYVYVLDYDQIEIYSAATLTGSKSLLTTATIVADSPETKYQDVSISSGFYFARFKNSISGLFSNYSDGIPVNAYGPMTARSIIDKALNSINKKASDLLSDEFAFQQIDSCQEEVIREKKRWSMMQQFDYVLGSLSQGQWRVALPVDCDDQNTNKSIYNFSIGTLDNLTWVDKEKWNEITAGVAWTTLASTFIVGATSMVLTSSANFPDSGSVRIGANTYAYSANNRTTNTLTITAATVAQAATGVDVFSGASLGTPEYWTTFGGYLYFYPVLGSELDGRSAILDYYKSLISIQNDTDVIVISDPTLVQYYLEWKFLKKIANGNETDGSKEARDLYLIRREKLKQKDSLNRTIKLKSRINSINPISSDDPKAQRIGNFI